MRSLLTLLATLTFFSLLNGCTCFRPATTLATGRRVAFRSQPFTLRMSPSEKDGELKRMSDNPDIWAQQQQLANEMTGVVEKAVRAEVNEGFAKQRLSLLGDTAFFGFFIFCLMWNFSENPMVAFSYSLGATLGLAYAYGLGRYVETIGGGLDMDTAAGAGFGQARFAFLIILLIIVGKFRSVGLLEIPAIAGFFTYQLASISQGLRDIDD